MNGTRDAVLQLQVHLGDGVLGKDRGIGDITWREEAVSGCEFSVYCLCGLGSTRTDGSGFNHVADGEALDRLVLGGASRAVAAADGLGVAATLLVAAAVKMLASNSHVSRSIPCRQSSKKTAVDTMLYLSTQERCTTPSMAACEKE